MNWLQLRRHPARLRSTRMNASRAAVESQSRPSCNHVLTMLYTHIRCCCCCCVFCISITLHGVARLSVTLITTTRRRAFGVWPVRACERAWDHPVPWRGVCPGRHGGRSAVLTLISRVHHSPTTDHRRLSVDRHAPRHQSHAAGHQTLRDRTAPTEFATKSLSVILCALWDGALLTTLVVLGWWS